MVLKLRNSILFSLVLLLGLLINTAVFAGQVLVQESYLQSNPEKKGKGQIYISDNKIKFIAENSDPIIIFNLNKNKLYIIDNKSKKYVQSSPQKYVELIQANLSKDKKEFKKKLANMPKEKRAQQLKLLEHKGIDIYGNEKPKNWEFKKTDQTKEIAGLDAQKIDLYEDGNLIQQLWISNKLQEIDFDKLAKFYGEIQKISQAPFMDLENQNRFGKVLTEIYKLGYVLETVDYNIAGNRIETVLSIKQVKTSNQDFKPPKDYQETKI